jgi:hypothetical protein
MLDCKYVQVQPNMVSLIFLGILLAVSSAAPLALLDGEEDATDIYYDDGEASGGALDLWCLVFLNRQVR